MGTDAKLNSYNYRRFKGGMLEAHPAEKSIIVNYKLEAEVYGNGIVDPMLADKKVGKYLNGNNKHIQGS